MTLEHGLIRTWQVPLLMTLFMLLDSESIPWDIHTSFMEAWKDEARRMFHCVDIPQLVYAFIRGWTRAVS